MGIFCGCVAGVVTMGAAGGGVCAAAVPVSEAVSSNRLIAFFIVLSSGRISGGDTFSGGRLTE